jgi:hypothetical protein
MAQGWLLPNTVHFVHVDSHPHDRNQDVQSLPHLAQLNMIKHHSRAKECLRTLISTSDPSLHDACLHGEGWHCSVRGIIKVTSDPALVIRKAIFGNHLQQHLQEHDQLSLATFQDVDWDAIELATVHFPPLC